MKRTDMVGQTYGRLTVLLMRPNGIVHAQCSCGRPFNGSGKRLRNGSTQSCGCLNGKPAYYSAEEAAFQKLYGRYQERARIANIAFQLSAEQFRALTKGACHYCGAEPSARTKLRRWQFKQPYVAGEYMYNGVDRKDSTGGYSAENTVSCCATCNYAKANLTVDEFLQWVFRVCAYQTVRAREAS